MQVVVNLYVNSPLGVFCDCLGGCWEEDGLFHLEKLLKFFRIKFHSEKLPLATGTTKKQYHFGAA